MPRFIALVRLSTTAHRDLVGARQRFELVARYLRRRGISVETTFLLDDTQHLFVLDAPSSPTRYLNRALARAWPEPAERPQMARIVHAEPWIRRPDVLTAPPEDPVAHRRHRRRRVRRRLATR
ncbi:MAG TPA: hypothetical protein VFD04_23115 [Actinomycetes bacterium]|jgi:hypothetical protein|nr:hypothetical protein [Actinomycetes bacterium]